MVLLEYYHWPITKSKYCVIILVIANNVCDLGFEEARQNNCPPTNYNGIFMPAHAYKLYHKPFRVSTRIFALGASKLDAESCLEL